jgi:heme A synthase
MLKSSTYFTRYAWFLVVYNVLVIAWGGLVRATGSGAGCGSHWPLCNGEVTHLPQTLETFIEIVHRWTSSLDGLLVILLVVWAFRAFGVQQRWVRWLAGLSLAFILIEGGLGAALVRYEWVADDASPERALVVALHLVNTLFLLAALCATAWLAGAGGVVRRREDQRALLLMAIALVSAVILSAMGAVTALGDTLFPSATLAEGFRADLDPASSFLIQLRVIHPAMALGTALYLLWALRWLGARGLGERVARSARRLKWVLGVQIAVGFVNLFLLAPLALQITHLILADVFWLALWLTALNVGFSSENVSPV